MAENQQPKPKKPPEPPKPAPTAPEPPKAVALDKEVIAENEKTFLRISVVSQYGKPLNGEKVMAYIERDGVWHSLGQQQTTDPYGSFELPVFHHSARFKMSCPEEGLKKIFSLRVSDKKIMEKHLKKPFWQMLAAAFKEGAEKGEKDED